METIRKNTRLLFILILPVYFFIVQSSLRNQHTHFCANGMVITHSHPLDTKNGDPANHKHSKTEICFFSNIHFDYYNISHKIHIDKQADELCTTFFEKNQTFLYSSAVRQNKLRGPPAFQIA